MGLLSIVLIPQVCLPNQTAFLKEKRHPGFSSFRTKLNHWLTTGIVSNSRAQAIKAGIDWAGARRQEREYFASTKPWCDLDSYYQSFLCTTKLTERLSTILAELITKRCDTFSVSFGTLT